MGSTYYVDPAAAGDNNGTSWTHAWTTIQTAFDTAVAGDIVYCRGTEVITAQIDVDTQTGTYAAGFIKFIGCNAAGNRDGTRYIINANSNAIHGIVSTATADAIWLENIEVKNCGGSTKNGFTIPGSSSGWVLLNCCANNCSGTGINGSAGSRNTYIRCVAYSNTLIGMSGGADEKYIFCSSHDNGTDGISDGGECVLLGCLFYDNGDDGIGNVVQTSIIINCSIDGNADNGIDVQSISSPWGPMMLGCRITNHSGAGDVGVDAVSRFLLTLGCYFEDNDTDIANAGVTYNVPITGDGAVSDIYDQANTNEGYTDLTDGAEDFNLRSDASLRRTAVTIPLV